MNHLPQGCHMCGSVTVTDEEERHGHHRKLLANAQQDNRDLDGDDLSIDGVKQRYLGPLGYREALHTAYLVQDFAERHLLAHPTVLLNKRIFDLVYQAVDALALAYQEIGALEPDFPAS